MAGRLNIHFVRWLGVVIMLTSLLSLWLIAKPVGAAWGGSEFTLTVNVSSTQGGTVTIDQKDQTTLPVTTTLATGTKVNLEAVPALGYEFAGWTGKLSSQENPITVEITCPTVMTANFVQVGAYRLTIEVIGGGTVTPAAGIHGYNQGTVVDITAIPNPGYTFTGWTGDVANPNSPITTITINSGKTVIANFSRPLYTLTMDMKGSGSISPSIGDHTCSEGSILAITATPNSGYQFTGWIGTVADTQSATTTVTVSSDMTVTANFAKTYTLTVQSGNGGSVTPAAGKQSYAEGTVVNITATPDKDYKFINWTGNVADAKSASTKVTIGSNMTVTANFSKIGLSPLLLGVIIGGGALVIVVSAWLLTRKRTPQT